MDYVDETRGDYRPLRALNLLPEDEVLLMNLGQTFGGRKMLYMPLDRGLSPERKIIVKPESLFPLLVKLGDRENIRRELDGYELVYLRIPPMNILPLETHLLGDERAALVFRYVTGGLVSELGSRLDTYLDSERAATGPEVLRELYDVALKKCHWLDGRPKIAHLNPPPLPEPDEGIAKADWQQMRSAYHRLVERCENAMAPHGVVHCDLHPKNVLITRHCAPVLIDFAMVKEQECVYIDYAKLEVHLQFQLPSEVTEAFWRVSDRVYSAEPLILPRTNKAVGSLVHTVRSTLWKNCLSRTVGLTNEDIDLGYRTYLFYCLSRIWSRAGCSDLTRARARAEALALVR